MTDLKQQPVIVNAIPRILSALILLFCVCSSRADNRPNVLFIVCDDLNTHVSTSGYKPIQTPALDLLADDGLTFHRAFCQYPVCGPSRASFLNSLNPESSGVLDNKADIRKTRPTISRARHCAGYSISPRAWGRRNMPTAWSVAASNWVMRYATSAGVMPSGRMGRSSTTSPMTRTRR